MGQSSLFVISRNFQSGFPPDSSPSPVLPVKASSFPQRRLGAEQDGRAFPGSGRFPRNRRLLRAGETRTEFPTGCCFSGKTRGTSFGIPDVFSNKTRTFPLFLFQLRGFCGIIAADRVRRGQTGLLLPPNLSGLWPRCAICPPQVWYNKKDAIFSAFPACSGRLTCGQSKAEIHFQSAHRPRRGRQSRQSLARRRAKAMICGARPQAREPGRKPTRPGRKPLIDKTERQTDNIKQQKTSDAHETTNFH